MTIAARAAGAAAGLLVDRVVGEPPSAVHPVARFGSIMQALEGRIWADRRRAGAAYAGAGLMIGLAAGATARSPASALGVATAGRELRRVAGSIADALDCGAIDEARSLLPSLVGRDPQGLDAADIRAAVVESLAENMVDAVVAPTAWALVGGGPACLGYRAVNTMDAMVGHRSPRYERFGWAAARLDDAANFVPARLFVVLLAAASPARAAAIVATVRRDAAAHPSPNAGVAEAAMAAALGCRLGGPLSYGGVREQRPELGDGDRPTAEQLRAAIALTSRIEWLMVAMLLGGATWGSRRGARSIGR